MSVVNMVVGAPTHEGATFVTKVTSGPSVRIKVANNSGMSGAVFFGPVSVNAQKVARITASGLAADTRYWWQVEDNNVVDTSPTGQFRTLPVEPGDPASFRFGAASCAGSSTFHSIVPGALPYDAALSNHAVFDTIRQKALAENWLFFCHLGDLHYYDLDEEGAGTLANYRTAYDDVLLQTRQHALYNQVAWVYTWDNHDFSQDKAGKLDENGNILSPGRNNACLAYRERVPHYTLPSGSGANPIYHSFQIGRVLFIVADVFSERVWDSTMFGSTQKTWMDNLLGSTSAEFLVWLNGSQWIHPNTNNAFPGERAEMLEMFGDRGFLDRMCLISGDRHSIGIDTGKPGPKPVNGIGFPVFHCASIDSGIGRNEFDQLAMADIGYDLAESPGRMRYGSFYLHDDGQHIAINGTVWASTRPHAWYSFGV